MPLLLVVDHEITQITVGLGPSVKSWQAEP